jgi:hypothetical protein
VIPELLAGISGAGLLATIGSTIYFAVKHSRAVEHAANVQVAQAHVEGEFARAEFEIETLRQQLDLEQRRADALQEVLNVESNPNSDLDAADLRSRLLRFAKATAARRQDDPGDAVVPQDAPAGTSPVADMLAGLATVR